jgi:hypothetical protein
MIDLPRHPLLNLIEPPEQESPTDDKKEKPKEALGSNAYYGRERLMQVLRRYEYWDDLIKACRTGEIEPTRLPGEQAKVHTELGVAYYCKGDTAAGDAEVEALRQLRAEELALKKTATSKSHWRVTSRARCRS